MKIRQGFVSNSSSSSFVVAFDRIPTSIEDVAEMLFAPDTEVMHPYQNTIYSAQTIAKTIWENIQEQTPNELKSIVEAISGGWFDDIPSYETYRGKDGKVDWKKYQKDTESAATKNAKSFIKSNKNKFIYTFHFSDNDGDYGCLLEHGEIFYKLNNIRTSYH